MELSDKGKEVVELCKMIDMAKKLPPGGLVLCQDCIIKKAIHYKDGIVWRCPHRTYDVKPEGYCEYGKRGNSNE